MRHEVDLLSDSPINRGSPDLDIAKLEGYTCTRDAISCRVARMTLYAL